MALDGLFIRGSRAPQRLLGRPESRELLSARLPWVLWSLVAWAALIGLRLIHLQVIEAQKYQARADSQHITKVPVPPIRGEILDRSGGSLAISLRMESLFCTPPAFYPQGKGRGEGPRQWGEPDRAKAERVASQLAPILEVSKASLLEKLLRRKPFVWIERQMLPSKVAAIKALKPDGVNFLSESKRHYPRGSLACQIIGFTNIDGVGQLGIEQALDEQLAGTPGELEAPRDAHGRLLVLQENYTRIPVNGSTLQLTIDATIQHVVEQTLEEAVRICRPATAYAVVVDPETGEILAMAGTPSFDPNHVIPRRFKNRSEADLSAAEREELKRELERQRAARKVHPIEDSYEPGSTMKIFTAAIALEERKVRLGETIHCEGGRWKYADKLVTDTHAYGALSFEEVLWKSSNIGSAKIGLRVEPPVHYSYLRKFGFGEVSGLNFPGESGGRLMAPDRWSRTTQLTMCYGYGLSVTPLQILMAGAALANGGKLMKPILVSRIYNDQGVLLRENKPEVRKRVLTEETAAMMREVLKGVVTSGTGSKAKLDGDVESFGKTGTARKYQYNYDPRHHYASYLGFFPADKPRFGMLFMLDDPAGDVTGGDVAAPLFKKIGDAIVRYRATGKGAEAQADLKLSLRDWPVSENDEAVVHVEIGRVPDLAGLSLKAALHRVVLAGGTPRVEEVPQGLKALKVVGQDPEAGAPLATGAPVRLRLERP